ncbi:LysR substrate-binding domain-containing protein [Allopusillimonas ginsengisoli]|uniref:LysR substrate-binding domain-containing protein n=1 Tax=Allopusillimonas ginsengisoli TaxID=453575 RepID=UPI0039C47DA0
MELRHLRHFVAVAEELSFTRAAERLHIGQPPLSQSIQALEADVGAQLFERTRRWVRLTEAGRLFLEDAYRILALTASASQNAKRAEKGEVGDLRLGFNNSMPLTAHFATTINAYRNRFPEVTLHLSEMSTMQQIEAIRERRLDLGYIRPPEVQIPDDILLTPVQLHPLMVITPSNHRLAGRKKISLKELENEHFVTFLKNQGTTLYPQIQRLCGTAGFTPKIVMEVREAATMMGLVAAGCGITILPNMFACINITNISHAVLSDAGASTGLILAYRSGEVSPLVNSFISIAMTHKDIM